MVVVWLSLPRLACLSSCLCLAPATHQPPRRQLLEGGTQRRAQGLTLLVRFAAPLLGCGGANPGQQAQPPQQQREGQQQWAGVQHDPEFYPLLRACLCDREASSRKQAAHVLAQALQQADGALHSELL